MNRVLDSWCERVLHEWPGPVGEAVAYSLRGPGKRLRPALVIAGYRSLGGSGDPTELASAVEVVHTYSLVHDDLPCMDDDELRRGRPTTHCRFDVATATEAAFRMVPLSARVLAAGAARLGLDAATTGAVALELFRGAGSSGMVGGQVMDLEAEGREVSREDLVCIHSAKTGALITASVVMGALAAEASADRVEAIRSYGREIGLAFQIVDDILDATATSSQLGKTAGKDAKQHKATYVSIVGLDAATREVEQHIRNAMDHLAAAQVDSELLGNLARFVAQRRN
ncbi:MAG: polyprenyl synthetase family protein [Gemmatimonadota bacterium]|nr:MAG: polyprenyl synthetase family protein [Gemmatimonadota bacterium]